MESLIFDTNTCVSCGDLVESDGADVCDSCMAAWNEYLINWEDKKNDTPRIND